MQRLIFACGTEASSYHHCTSTRRAANNDVDAAELTIILVPPTSTSAEPTNLEHAGLLENPPRKRRGASLDADPSFSPVPGIERFRFDLGPAYAYYFAPPKHDPFETWSALWRSEDQPLVFVIDGTVM